MHFDVFKKKAFLIRSIITSITGEELETSGRLQSGVAVSLNYAAVILQHSVQVTSIYHSYILNLFITLLTNTPTSY